MSVSSALRYSRSIIGFFSDKEYYPRLYKVAIPIALQQFIMSSLNMVGVVMIGQLGAVPVAAVGSGKPDILPAKSDAVRDLHRLSHVYRPIMGDKGYSQYP